MYGHLAPIELLDNTQETLKTMNFCITWLLDYTYNIKTNMPLYRH